MELIFIYKSFKIKMFMKKLLYLLVIILTIAVGCWLYNKYCCNCCSNECEGKKSELADSHRNGFALNFDNELNLKSDYNINFLKNGFDYLSPIHATLDGQFVELKGYFDKNSGKRILKITGHCTADEKNTSMFPNLGFARANNIKNYLVAKGMSVQSIEIDGIVKDKLSLNGDTILGPLDFSISKVDENTSSEDYNALKDKINANPLTLYFETGQSEISLTDEQRRIVASIVRYLDKVSSSKAIVVGHTDNAGDRQANINLGKQRADFVKEILQKNGINTIQLLSDSKGPDQPIAENSTAEGKAKNRRVTVNIQ